VSSTCASTTGAWALLQFAARFFRGADRCFEVLDRENDHRVHNRGLRRPIGLELEIAVSTGQVRPVGILILNAETKRCIETKGAFHVLHADDPGDLADRHADALR